MQRSEGKHAFPRALLLLSAARVNRRMIRRLVGLFQPYGSIEKGLPDIRE